MKNSLEDLNGQIFGDIKAVRYNKQTRKWICICKYGHTCEKTS